MSQGTCITKLTCKEGNFFLTRKIECDKRTPYILLSDWEFSISDEIFASVCCITLRISYTILTLFEWIRLSKADIGLLKLQINWFYTNYAE